MSYIPEYHENYYRVEGTAFNQGKIGIGTINPVQLLHVSGGNIRLDGTGYVNGDLNVTGNLNVYGTTAQFAVSQVIAEDKSLELNVATGTAIGGGNYTTVGFSDDAGADFGGLILKSTSAADSRGVTDKHLVYRTASPASGWVSNLRFVVSGNYGKDTLNLSDTSANVGLTIATDTNLYRSGADQLSTDDNFASTSNGGKTTLQLTNTTANVGMTIGGDANLYRSGANTLRTDDNLGVVLDFNVDGNTILGDTTSDTVSFNARANTNLEPSTNNSRNLGSSALNWANIFVNALQVAGNTTLTGNLNVSGNTTLGDAYGDTITITGKLLRGIAVYSGAGVTTQASSTSIATDKVIVTGAGILNGALNLPTAIAGMEVEVKNRAGQAINIYANASPGTDRIFDSSILIANNTALTLASNANRNFVCAPSGGINVWFT